MFRISEPVKGSVCTPSGVVEFDLDAGEHAPTDEGERVALAFLVSIGAAETVQPRPRRSTKEN